jgi:hypothetical protein
MAATSSATGSQQTRFRPTIGSHLPTEENIQRAFSDAVTGDVNNLLYFGIIASKDLEGMLNDYAEGKRIVSKLFDVCPFDFFEFDESDVTDGSKCEISPQSKAVKKFQSGRFQGTGKDLRVPGDKFSILVSVKWVEYIRSYCELNDLCCMGATTHKLNLDISRKRNDNAHICKKFIAAVSVIFKPPISNTDFPKGYHKLSHWLKLVDSKDSDSKVET